MSERNCNTLFYKLEDFNNIGETEEGEIVEKGCLDNLISIDPGKDYKKVLISLI